MTSEPLDYPIASETNAVAGGVIIDALYLTTVDGRVFDIRNFCVETIIHEDLFSNVMMGHCLMVDSASFINQLPIRGTEFLTAVFRTPNFTETIGRSFYVTGLQQRQFVSTDREISYILSFVSMEGIRDNVTPLFKRFSGKTDAVVKTLYEDYLATPRFYGAANRATTTLLATSIDHSSSVSFLPTGWSPFKCINWVAARSLKTPSSAPTHLFFESNKAFYFASINELIEQQVGAKRIFAEYIYSPNAAAITRNNQGFTYTKPEIDRQYGVVEEMKPFDQFELLREQDYGFLSNKLITHDIVTKEYKEFGYDHYQAHRQYPHLEDVTKQKNTQTTALGVPRSTDAFRSVRAKHFKLFNDSTDPRFELWAQARNSLLYELSRNSIQIVVPGRTDIEVGKVINFLYPKGQDKNDNTVAELEFDPLYSGLYLITSIKHSFALDKHLMVMEIAKDSFAAGV